jgi:hypothetical protein
VTPRNLHTEVVERRVEGMAYWGAPPTPLDAGTETEDRSQHGPRDRVSPLGVLVLGAAVILVAGLWGNAGGAGDGSRIRAAPFMGAYRLGVTWRLVPVVVLAIVVVGYAIGAASRLRWRAMLAATFALAVAWAVALCFVDGGSALTSPLESRYEYLRWVPVVESPGEFLRTFVDRLPHEATHVKSHPPGIVLILWALDRVGLGGSGPAAALILAAVGVAAVAVVVTTRHVVSEAAARQVAPFVAILPAAVWMATSPDALFLGVTATGVAAVAVATSRTGARSHQWGWAAGLLLGTGLFLSYGMAALLVVPAAVIFVSRRWVLALWVGAGIAAVVIAFASAGFWWPEGLAATIERYRVGIGVQRRDEYLLFANIAILAVAVGPAVWVGLARAGWNRRFLVCGVASAVLLAINASGLSEGEVERIWIPFFPGVATAAIGLHESTALRQRWLALQAAAAIALQCALRSPW